MSEEDYLKEPRPGGGSEPRSSRAVADGFEAPDALIAALARHDAATPRCLLPVAELVKTSIRWQRPATASLPPGSRRNKADYAAPEYRKITYVKLQNEDIADPEAISEDAARARL